MIGRRALLGSMALTLAAGASLAQEKYPSRPIRLIVGFPPGGPADVMGRLIAQRLSVTLGQVIVENRPGAGSTLAGKQVALAEPDGYTIMLGSTAPLAIGPALYPNSGYDPRTSFVPIALFSDTPYIMVGAVDAPFKTVPELLAYARANPGRITFGVPNGAPPHMLAEMFRMKTGADIVIVPYRGASTLITDMIAGRIHGGFETTSVMFAHLHEGKIRALGVVRDERLPQLPEVPTLIESGVDGVIGSSWIGVVAPSGTPKEIVARLRVEVMAAAHSPEVHDRLKMLAAEPKPLTADEFGAFIAGEYERIGSIMRAAKVKAE
jgi:tripartite-type tricarboxylate transporter receptor subunit TctC